MRPATHDIEFTRGDYYSLRVAFTDQQDPPQPLFWTGLTLEAQLRDNPNDLEYVAFDVDDSGLAGGLLILSLSESVTATLGGAYVWDLHLIDGDGHPTTLIAGQVFVKLDVTRTVGS